MPASLLSATLLFARRLVAGASVALLLLLGASSVSPSLHEHLHADGGDHASPSHSCAVVLFATGAILAAELGCTPPITVWRDGIVAAADEVSFAEPDRLRPPPCGPPAA